MSEDAPKFKSDRPIRKSAKKSRQDSEDDGKFSINKLGKEDILVYKREAKKFKDQLGRAIAFVIKNLREEAKISIKKMAEITERSVGEVEAFENNTREVDILFMFDMCSAVRKSLTEIIGDITLQRILIGEVEYEPPIFD